MHHRQGAAEVISQALFRPEEEFILQSIEGECRGTPGAAERDLCAIAVASASLKCGFPLTVPCEEHVAETLLVVCAEPTGNLDEVVAQGDFQGRVIPSLAWLWVRSTFCRQPLLRFRSLRRTMMIAFGRPHLRD